MHYAEILALKQNAPLFMNLTHRLVHGFNWFYDIKVELVVKINEKC